ncbi:MAG: glutamyl-tRNA reductase [Omnitrophica WOR_2 bacterium RIFCSPHIGHO2_01_FULL_48_9]|nr:MAG: glutamyl-tRNA reductase [Omnitrophica WOR_2 bacterium RIFCSPHIGHO2_02_FULL_48_11]OGX30247.1 MAG: glutamyl-tRNA reductase [Omnitrophica WOR_2 bacterium RIFCSPHIGHO2_01_FULL_48_9]
MNLIVVGLNHKTAPIDIREKFFLSSLEQDLLLSELRSNPSVVEAFTISTCNRTEVYVNGLSTEMFFDFIIRLICSVKRLNFTKDFHKYFYILNEQETVRHLLRVTSGLDSLVIGEKQILGQIKSAFEKAQEKTMFGKDFNILSNIAIRAGKKAQSETDISYGGSSVSWAAMVHAEKTLGTLEDKSVLIIGAGKMSELAVGQINSKGVKKIYLMNRTQEKAQNLSEKYSCIPSAFSEIKEILAEVDICICSVGAPHYILDRELVAKVLAHRQERRLIFIDISMPRNIDPQVATLDNVSLSHIDDLEKVVAETMRIRQAAIGKVEEIIENKLREYYQKINKIKEMPPVANSPAKTLSSSA